MSDFFATQLGSSPGVFIGITLIFMGGCAIMSGQALAQTWRPMWQTIPYALLLGGADRFLVHALFQGRLLSPAGYLLDAAILVGLSLLSFRATRARQMARQYPWLFERIGLLGWRERERSEP